MGPLTWLQRKWLALPPAMLLSGSFAALVTIGTAGLLWLPGIYVEESARLRLVDALFMATSAVCVTGLAVVDIATTLTRWGQAWILLLIQLGGLGIVTITSLIIGAMGRRLSLRTEMISGPSDSLHGEELNRVTARVLTFTLLSELFVAVVLWVQLWPRFGPLDAAWHAGFHAVSAFCNAGFSTFSDSLAGMATQPGILFTISAAIIVGGFGYLSSFELARWWNAGRQRAAIRLSAHTYAAAMTTLFLLGAGTIAYAVLEWNGALQPFGTVDRISNAWFASATARTAGFNSLDYGVLGNGAAFITLLLMTIGGSPGSTAGGIKTTALAILAAMAWSRIRGLRFVRLHHRSIPDGNVERVVSLTIVFFTLITAATLLLSFTETQGVPLETSREAFLPLMFEATSAAATVGLTMGLTPTLSDPGRLILVALMFIGRVGPLSFIAAISLRGARLPSTFRPAAEHVIVG